MRGRGADRRPEPRGHRVRPAAGPLHALPAHRRGRPGHAVSGARPGPAPRALADALRRAGPGPRLLAPARLHRSPQPALGDRPVESGGPAPGGPARLDRPAGRRVRCRGGAPRGAGPGRGGAAAVPAGRPGHRPRFRQPAAGPGDREVRPGARLAGGRRGRARGRCPARRTVRGRAGDQGVAGRGAAADLGRGVAGPGPAAGAARGGQDRGPLDPGPLVVHRPPRPGPLR